MSVTGEGLDATITAEKLAVINDKAFICITGVKDVLSAIESNSEFGELHKRPHIEKRHDLVTPSFQTTDPEYAGYEFTVGERFITNKRTLRSPFNPGVRSNAVFAGHFMWHFEDAGMGGEIDIPIGGFEPSVKLPTYLIGETSLESHLSEKLAGFHTKLGFVAAKVGVEVPAID